MSDASTEIARDQERNKLYHYYLLALKEFLSSSGGRKESLKKVIEVAGAVDDVRGGYWGSKTSISSGLKKELEELLNGDKKAWAMLLVQFFLVDGMLSPIIDRKCFYDEKEIFNEIKNISPFKGKHIYLVNYGCGFVNIRHDFDALVQPTEQFIKLIIEDKDMKTYDADTYVIFANSNDFSGCEVFWLRCGILGVNGPRTAKK
ncbi:hypothetical protein HZC33_01085 [Candidatus Wolfebacteria bacterium]|nr:hypothetical protein [Candidatus Wolfebacteria bacterium]